MSPLRLRTRLLATLLPVFLSSGAALAAPDVVLLGGRIHTLADDQPSTVEALAITDGEVTAAGTEAEILALADDDTHRIDLEGNTAIPGLVDAHAHLDNLGRALVTADLRDTRSAEECVRRALEHQEKLPEGSWLRGRGWDQNDWADTNFPTREILDEAFGDRPVVLERIDGHAIWVNGAALEAAGIDAATPDPEGGEILRNPATGEPTGVLVDNAEDLIEAVLPEPSVEEWKVLYRAAFARALSEGLTCVHEMGTDLSQLQALEELEAAGQLNLRMVVYLGGEEVLGEYVGGPRGLEPTARLRVEGVKLYADGALGSRGAALLEDYSDRPGHRGLLVSSPDALTRASAAAFRRNLGVAIHAIGDRANRLSLDALIEAHGRARAQRAGLPSLGQARARIEHAQHLHPDDMPRFAASGIVPSMQPTHCTSDMPWAGERLGQERLKGAYAWRSLRDLGCILPMGSDFPVERVSPRLGLWAARTRRPPEAPEQAPWFPEQQLDRLESLLGFTVWPAQVLHLERRGRLTPGSRADVTVLDRDPLADGPQDILQAKVKWTLVDGEVAYRDADTD